MKISIASDVHNNFENLNKAISISNNNGCKYFMFSGDFTEPFGLQNFINLAGDVEMVWGNNENKGDDYLKIVNDLRNVTMHGDVFDGEVEGLKIFMNHLPELSEIAVESGKYDLCIHGHSHKYRNEKIGDTLLICPGNLKGWREEAGFVILDTNDMTIDRILL